MSSHSFTMFSPALNCEADICIGYDSASSEPFLTFESPVRDYMSHGKNDLADIKTLAMEKLGIDLPPVIVAAVEHDIVDTRMGLGAEVNRRFKQYTISTESESDMPGLAASITRAGDKFQVVETST